MLDRPQPDGAGIAGWFQLDLGAVAKAAFHLMPQRAMVDLEADPALLAMTTSSLTATIALRPRRRSARK